MYLIICCNQYLKFTDLWDFKKHLQDRHGYSSEASDKRVLEMIEECKEIQPWKVA